MSEDGLPPLREVIARHGLTPHKGLGQNFLLDLNLTRRIARAAAPLEGFTVIEIGPGPGGLTRGLLMEGASRVIAIERDTRTLPALGEIAAHWPGRLQVIEADALSLDLSQLAQGPVKVVANLPYNIATALLVEWLTVPWPPFYSSLTLMFQKEVAERIVAPTRHDAYGRLSVLAQWRARCRRLFDIDRRAFTPPPTVTSSLVQIVPQAEPADAPPLAALEAVTRAAFGQRRKMLRSSLKSAVDDPQGLLTRAGIAATARAEELSVDDFCTLARLFAG